MLPGFDADGAERVATDLQARLTAGLADAGFPLRLSVGVATYPYDADRSSQLLRVVDQALYEAKAMGKGTSSASASSCAKGTRARLEARVPLSGDERTQGSIPPY